MATWGPTAVAATADDGYEQDGSWTTNHVYLGNYTTTVNGGVRFQNVTVPAGATIDSATLLLIKYGMAAGSATSVHARVYGDKVANAPAWGAASLPSGITQTTAYVAVDPAAWENATQLSLDVKDLVAEIIGLGSWASGNAIRFGILNNGTTGDNLAVAYDIDDADSGSVATLAITYTAGGAASNTPSSTMLRGMYKGMKRGMGGAS